MSSFVTGFLVGVVCTLLATFTPRLVWRWRRNGNCGNNPIKWAIGRKHRAGYVQNARRSTLTGT